MHYDTLNMETQDFSGCGFGRGLRSQLHICTAIVSGRVEHIFLLQYTRTTAKVGIQSRLLIEKSLNEQSSCEHLLHMLNHTISLYWPSQLLRPGKITTIKHPCE
ncbi:hypothetical protein GDO78_018371 [Eleutherodactylus coqui]|uniref:Uncharacterized protein n=1 Tax=Eleutherodactylus coqui TaxID=57060 RepID=A0A8J6K012_ELECQ|nr:hypothetical protein GDO78_018371 [Eleutherodactylus coqui]